MRQETINLYSINELSETAKEKAHSEYYCNRDADFTSEMVETLKAFAAIFPVSINNYEFDSNYSNVNWSFELDEETENLKGLRLQKKIWTNYKDQLFKGKYYSVKANKWLKHKRVKTEVLSNGKYFNSYRSAITLEASCVLTGVCFDEDILQPIYDFLKGAKVFNAKDYRYSFENTNFFDLMNDCIDAWQKSVKDELKSQESFEYFEDIAEANNYVFTESGELY